MDLLQPLLIDFKTHMILKYAEGDFSGANGFRVCAAEYESLWFEAVKYFSAKLGRRPPEGLEYRSVSVDGLWVKVLQPGLTKSLVALSTEEPEPEQLYEMCLSMLTDAHNRINVDIYERPTVYRPLVAKHAYHDRFGKVAYGHRGTHDEALQKLAELEDFAGSRRNEVDKLPPGTRQEYEGGHLADVSTKTKGFPASREGRFVVGSMGGDVGETFNAVVDRAIKCGDGFACVWEAEWGEHWWPLFKRNNLSQPDRETLVLTKLQDGKEFLGFYQQLEITWMKESGIPYKFVNKHDYIFGKHE